MWDFIPTAALIQLATNGNYGLAHRHWQAQLQEIRQLPETADRDER